MSSSPPPLFQARTLGYIQYRRAITRIKKRNKTTGSLSLIFILNTTNKDIDNIFFRLPNNQQQEEEEEEVIIINISIPSVN